MLTQKMKYVTFKANLFNDTSEDPMNYGKKFLYIMMSAFGMVIAITGICYKTGYFTGHEGNSSYVLIVAGLLIMIYGLKKLHETP